MKMLPTFIEGTIITLLWLLCNSGGFTQTTETACNRPEHIVTKQAYLYQSIDIVNVTVNHCRYHEENVCDEDICRNCKIGVENYTVEKKFVNQYDDITNNCLNAIQNHNYMSKYGFEYSTTEETFNSYRCNDNKTDLNITVRITVTKDKAKLDTNQDRLMLKSGAVCRYSSGFCHDDKRGIDVMWDVSRKKHITCSKLKKINVSDVYNFALGAKNYSMIQNDDRYFLSELKSSPSFSSLCHVNIWTTDKGWLVADNMIKGANNFENSATSLDLGLSFKHKQDVYDFVVDSCVLQGNKEELPKTLLESELKMKLYQESLMNDLEGKLQCLRGNLEMFFYVTVFVVSCSVVVLVSAVCFVYWKLKKNTVSGGFTLPNPSNDNVYEYTSSEYNINSLYGKKY